jgi:transglycosylase-like protein with SLT domain/D-alanyl-D-alanine carboxypeptidase-like protein/putative Flp pilus-assembly TadE/G-like protein
MKGPPVVIATAVGDAGGGAALAAAVGVVRAVASGRAALVADFAPREGRLGPTLLASTEARRLEELLRERGLEAAAARGHLCSLQMKDEAASLDALAAALASATGASAVLVHLRPGLWQAALDHPAIAPRAGLLRAELPADRPLTALAVRDLWQRGVRVRVVARPLGRIASRRALAGIDPGGAAQRRVVRMARGLLGDAGQALPGVVGMTAVLITGALALASIVGAVTGKGRVQRAADLAALSAARSMRDDFGGLFAPVRLPDGRPNPRHLSKTNYLSRAGAAGKEAGRQNGVAERRLRISFPDRRSFAPLRARAVVTAEIEPASVADSAPASVGRQVTGRPIPVVADAVAEASPPGAPPGVPERASGGGYSGPLAYRQGKPMRPDVAVAFDRIAAAARGAGLTLLISSAYRSDAEQARLFAAHPDPRWVAPPGRSLHRCGTELDLGPVGAYGWLAAQAPRFGFLKRYSWEPWHFGYVGGPAPCSAAGGGEGDRTPPLGLPNYVPSPYRAAIERAAARWDVSANLLAAQLLAESNFNPLAVSAAGAQGIAQFMPGTAAAYDLRDPFDAPAAIDAQAHLMSDLLRRFRSVPLALAAYNAGPGAVSACGCIPPYAETRAYVARIMGLLDGAGELPAPTLEVRLVD